MTAGIQQMRRRVGELVALGVLVAACGGATPSGTPGSAASTAAASTPASTSVAGSITPPSAAPSKAAGGSGQAVVDLTFTGTRVFTAKGTNGTCKLATASGTTQFGFEASEADYPALGQSFSLAEFGNVDIKWVIGPGIAYGNDPNVVIEVSADHHSVTIDQDLSPFSSSTGTTPGPQHVKGTIFCS